MGEISQMRWVPTTADTGADLQVGLHIRHGDTGIADTGDGWLFYNVTDCLGTQFTKVPTQPMHGSDGSADPADTGAQFGAPIVTCGDRIRVKVIPGGSACVGRLYIWTTD
jgi:TPP-dependent 2-oxoacid decarboxylase